MHYLMATSRMVSCASTREGRRRFFERTLAGQDGSLDAPVGTSRRRTGQRAQRRRLASVISADEGRRPDVLCEEREYRARVRANRRRVSSDARPPPARRSSSCACCARSQLGSTDVASASPSAASACASSRPAFAATCATSSRPRWESPSAPSPDRGAGDAGHVQTPCAPSAPAARCRASASTRAT